VVAVPILTAFNGSGISYLDPILPTGLPLLWLFLGGTSAAIAHLFLTYAFKFAPVTLLGPMHYMEIVTASILGYVVFRDLFNGLAAIGVLIKSIFCPFNSIVIWPPKASFEVPI